MGMTETKCKTRVCVCIFMYVWVVVSIVVLHFRADRYKKYVTLDPLGVVTKTRTSAEDDDSDRLAAAPSTIQQGEELPQLAAESYFYVPGLGAVPEFSLPDFLPELGGL